jgi:ubiquinone/menaquinone biosynthesis C-methylase UbiE
MKMDYDALSRDYDLTRSIKLDTVKRLTGKIDFSTDTRVLDFGCGTGNYTHAVKRLTGAEVYGVEPSDGMREKAAEKVSGAVFLKGDHTGTPLSSLSIDLAYMTDVIHHVPDIKAMFCELNRVLKPKGLICVVTESHKQIETRFWSAYFPATVAAEKKRYPDINVIVDAAAACGLSLQSLDTTDREQEFLIPREFMELVERKGFSMFRLISDADYESGLKTLRRDFENKSVIHTDHGESFVWLTKSNA